MNRTPIVFVLLLLGSLALSAQNRSLGTAGPALPASQDNSQSVSTVLVLPFDSIIGACPIGMHARQGVWDHTITVHRGGEQFKGPFGQRIVLTLTDAHPAKIVAATVRVHGFNGENRMMQTSSAEGNATKTLRTGFTELGNDTFSADLYISGFTAVTSVKLQDVTYSDGSTWHSNQANPCRVAPDPLMLVAGH